MGGTFKQFQFLYGLIAAILILSPTTFAFAGTCASNGESTGYNWYSGGLNTDSEKYTVFGEKGYISVPPTTPSVPDSNNAVSDEAIWNMDNTNKYGLELGWGVGWSVALNKFEASPTLYETWNGPGEYDGPTVPLGSNYWYITYTDSNLYSHALVYTDSSLSTIYWNPGARKYPDSTPGSYGFPRVGAQGEVTDNASSTIQMGTSTMSNLYYMNSSGGWVPWSNNVACNDLNYWVQWNSATSDGNGGTSTTPN